MPWLIDKAGWAQDDDGNYIYLGEDDPYDGKTRSILTVPVTQATDDAERRRRGERVRS